MKIFSKELEIIVVRKKIGYTDNGVYNLKIIYKVFGIPYKIKVKCDK